MPNHANNPSHSNRDHESQLQPPYPTNLELRVRYLEDQHRAMQDKVGKLHDSVLGTLDGRPGVLSRIERVGETVEAMSEKFTVMDDKLDGLRLDKAKVVGIVGSVGAVVTLVFKYVLK